MLVEVNALSGDHVGSVSTTRDDIGHNGDESVLLDVEGTRVELEGVSEDRECVVGHNAGPEATDAAVQC